MAPLADVASCLIADITQAETIEDMADAVLAVAPERFALAGFSLGGFVAQEILRRASNRVSRLALLNTSWRPDSPRRKKERQRLNMAASQPGRFVGVGQRLLESYLHPSNLADKAIADRIQTMAARLGPVVMRRQSGIERKDGRAVLRTFVGPCLILCGEFDRVTDVAQHREMAEMVRGSTLLVVPGAGHMTPIEQPAVVTRAMLRWLADR
nr:MULTISPECIES: alpha/beta hydrolase [unclassified Chelatococcus]